MERDETKKVIEALLFVSDKPLSADTLRDVLKDVEPAAIKAITDELNGEYASTGRPFQIKEIAGGYQLLTDPVYSKWIALLYKKGPDRLSGPSLETLAIIAYKQPIARSEIEAIRGVNVDRILHGLEEKELIRTRGRLDAPGRPILYGTTTGFLKHFGLKSLGELPKLKEFQESDLEFIRERERARLMRLDENQPPEGEPPAEVSTEAPAVEPASEPAAEAPAVEPTSEPAAEALAVEPAVDGAAVNDDTNNKEAVHGSEEIAQSN